MAPDVEKQVANFKKWHALCRIGHRLVIMVRRSHISVQYAPLYIQTITLPGSCMLSEFSEMVARYKDCSAIRHTSDKLRWHRLKNELYQEQVADYVGLYRSTYANYEDASRDYYPPDKLEKLAELYKVPTAELMDDYNLFLYKGQGQQIKNLRQHLGLTQLQLAKRMNVSRNMVYRWEINQIQITKKTWEALNKLDRNDL